MLLCACSKIEHASGLERVASPCVLMLILMSADSMSLQRRETLATISEGGQETLCEVSPECKLTVLNQYH